jgi:hypothetical protein
MYRPAKLMAFCLALSMSLAAEAQTAVGRWNLGEQDAGAAIGSAGAAVSKDAISTNDLISFGAPVYAAGAPNTGSTLSMSFDGASLYQGSLVDNGAGFDSLYGSLDFNNFSLSCDVYMTAPGAAGFSFPVSIGKNGGGIAIVEVGGAWYLIHQSVANSAAGPAVELNAWTHLDLVRKDFGSGVQSRLFINGAATAAVTNSSSPNIPGDFLTIGANENGNALPGDVEGFFQGQVDNVVITNLNLGAPPVVRGIAVSPGTLYTGNSIILTATGVSGDPAGRTFTWRKNGVAVTNTAIPTVIFSPATTNFSGNYDVVVTNNFGGPLTSSIVSVTIEDPSFSKGGDVAVYHMGDNDPGAVAGSAANPTTKIRFLQMISLPREVRFTAVMCRPEAERSRFLWMERVITREAAKALRTCIPTWILTISVCLVTST